MINSRMMVIISGVSIGTPLDEVKICPVPSVSEHWTDIGRLLLQEHAVVQLRQTLHTVGEGAKRFFFEIVD